MTRKNNRSLPKVSVVMPVLNESYRLSSCLSSIKKQDYPKNKLEIVIADGGSEDNSIKIAKKFGARVVHNKLRTSESGKAISLKNTKGEIILLLDGDNLLTDKKWIRKMVEPLRRDSSLIGSESLYYTYRKTDGFIDRYCALMGMNDPFCYWLGSYDRYCVLSKKWTGLNIKSTKVNGNLEMTLKAGNIPTIGSNGCMFRKQIFIENRELQGDYVFDMDILELLCNKYGPQKFVKVNTGVVHLYCGTSLRRFFRKQRRRVKDFLFRRNLKNIFLENSYEKRLYTYGQSNQLRLLIKIIMFTVSCLLIFPLVVQSLVGFSRKHDFAWFAHPLLCWITLISYATGTVQSVFINSEYSRKNWK